MINTKISTPSHPIRAWSLEERVETEVMDLLFHKSLNHMNVMDLWEASLIYHPALKPMKYEVVFTKTQDSGYRLMRLKIGPDFKDYVSKRGYLLSAVMSTIKCFLVPNAPITPPPKNPMLESHKNIDITEPDPEEVCSQAAKATYIAPPKISRLAHSILGITPLQALNLPSHALTPKQLPDVTPLKSTRQQQLQQLLVQQSAQRAAFDHADDDVTDYLSLDKAALAAAAQAAQAAPTEAVPALANQAKKEEADRQKQIKQREARKTAEANRRARITLLKKQRQQMEEEMQSLAEAEAAEAEAEDTSTTQ